MRAESKITYYLHLLLFIEGFGTHMSDSMIIGIHQVWVFEYWVKASSHYWLLGLNRGSFK